jgi:hypothetical protein
MRKFSFPLDRVMDWRRTQARVQEAKLEQLHAEAGGIDARRAAVSQQRSESEQAVASVQAITGAELAALDAFRRFAAAENVRLERQRLECQQRVDAQIQLVAGKRRDVRLLERLRTRRLQAWKTGLDREIEIEAHEAHLVKWKRSR